MKKTLIALTLLISCSAIAQVDFYQLKNHAAKIAYTDLAFKRCAIELSQSPYKELLNNSLRYNKAYGYLFDLDRDKMLEVVNQQITTLNRDLGNSSGWDSCSRAVRKIQVAKKSLERVEMLY